MGVERVSDVDDPRLADYRDLKDGARRRRDGTFIAESRQVVRRLLGGSRFRARSVLAAEAAAEDLRDVLTDGLPVYVAPEATLQRVVGFNIHRGCLAVGERGAELALDGLLDARVLLVLEGVTNPDNIGGAFRNAMAFGVGGVVLAPRCSDPLYRKAIRVSMGGTLVVPFAAAASWPEALVRLRERGFTIVAPSPAGPRSPSGAARSASRPRLGPGRPSGRERRSWRWSLSPARGRRVRRSSRRRHVERPAAG